MSFLRAWWRVLQLEAPDWQDKVGVVLHVVGCAYAGGFVKKAQRTERKNKCTACPIYDPELQRCRPHNGSPLGCGCFVPALVWIRKPYSTGCWARQYLAGSGYGWE